jgi:hypothetical protein
MTSTWPTPGLWAARLPCIVPSTADDTTGVGRYAEAVGDLALKGGPTGWPAWLAIWREYSHIYSYIMHHSQTKIGYQKIGYQEHQLEMILKKELIVLRRWATEPGKSNLVNEQNTQWGHLSFISLEKPDTRCQGRYMTVTLPTLQTLPVTV